MKTDPRWSLTTTVAVNMLDLEYKNGWVRYQDVVHLIREIENACGKEQIELPKLYE